MQPREAPLKRRVMQPQAAQPGDRAGPRGDASKPTPPRAAPRPEGAAAPRGPAPRYRMDPRAATPKLAPPSPRRPGGDASGDIPRMRYEPGKRYSGVREQQGRVRVDEDYNDGAPQEQSDLERPNALEERAPSPRHPRTRRIAPRR